MAVSSLSVFYSAGLSTSTRDYDYYYGHCCRYKHAETPKTPDTARKVFVETEVDKAYRLVDDGLEVAAVGAVRMLEESLGVVHTVGKGDLGDGAIGSRGQAPGQSTSAAAALFFFPLIIGGIR